MSVHIDVVDLSERAMAARSKVAPPVPARKQSAAASSSTSAAAPTRTVAPSQTAATPSQQQAITLRPLLPADSGAPMVYVHAAAGGGPAQTAFGGPPAAIQPQRQPMNLEVCKLSKTVVCVIIYADLQPQSL